MTWQRPDMDFHAEFQTLGYTAYRIKSETVCQNSTYKEYRNKDNEVPFSLIRTNDSKVVQCGYRRDSPKHVSKNRPKWTTSHWRQAIQNTSVHAQNRIRHYRETLQGTIRATSVRMVPQILSPLRLVSTAVRNTARGNVTRDCNHTWCRPALCKIGEAPLETRTVSLLPWPHGEEEEVHTSARKTKPTVGSPPNTGRARVSVQLQKPPPRTFRDFRPMGAVNAWDRPRNSVNTQITQPPKQTYSFKQTRDLSVRYLFVPPRDIQQPCWRDPWLARNAVRPITPVQNTSQSTVRKPVDSETAMSPPPQPNLELQGPSPTEQRGITPQTKHITQRTCKRSKELDRQTKIHSTCPTSSTYTTKPFPIPTADT